MAPQTNYSRGDSGRVLRELSQLTPVPEHVRNLLTRCWDVGITWEIKISSICVFQGNPLIVFSLSLSLSLSLFVFYSR